MLLTALLGKHSCNVTIDDPALTGVPKFTPFIWRDEECWD